jgi:hypothetical protein
MRLHCLIFPQNPSYVDSPTASVTPVVTSTPTPLALEAQDDIIEDGDDERTIAYPVSLQVALSDGSPP